jgi:hypothetical protein
VLLLTTVSVTSHPPVAKCNNLEFLDLSHVKDLDAAQLLHITRKLTSLVKLSTPPGIFARSLCIPKASLSPNLEILQLNGLISDEGGFWSRLSKALPISLHTLIFEDTCWEGPYGTSYRKIAFSQIKSIQMHVKYGAYYPQKMADLFPNVENLHISMSMLRYFNSDEPLFMQNVQRLALTWTPVYTALSPDLVPRALWPKLWQLRVDGSQANPVLSEDGFPLDFMIVARDMRNRATMMGRDPSKAFIWKQERGVMPFED